MVLSEERTPSQVQAANAFLLGLKEADPDAVLSTVSLGVFKSTYPPFRGNPMTDPAYPGPDPQPFTAATPNAPWPGYPSSGIPATYDCASPLSYFMAATPHVGVPFDCVAIDRLLAQDPQIDTLTHQHNGFFPQNYTLKSQDPDGSRGFTFTENMMADTLGDPAASDDEDGYFAAHDLDDMLGDPRVLTATGYDLQPLLEHITSSFLTGSLQPASQDYVLTLDGARTVEIARISPDLSAEQRSDITELAGRALDDRKPEDDPFCGRSAARYLGEAYAFTDGCMRTEDKIAGMTLAPAITRLEPCTAQLDPAALVPDPNTSSAYPIRCTP
ncbi:hypothetical protein [Krasilnikoviella flava]|uniref:Uncharacterized protein n=1 Tax=Krasilnikoviella flava TaxID=526729 RepID=A0A1T5L0F3_9MICO|nr:hypothetical protein [Krasilnikoviella flava]SKC68878.1 hypothetical protein SAMN04324258_2643 [Krasilnikoviella flava]